MCRARRLLCVCVHGTHHVYWLLSFFSRTSSGFNAWPICPTLLNSECRHAHNFCIWLQRYAECLSQVYANAILPIHRIARSIPHLLVARRLLCHKTRTGRVNAIIVVRSEPRLTIGGRKRQTKAQVQLHLLQDTAY